MIQLFHLPNMRKVQTHISHSTSVCLSVHGCEQDDEDVGNGVSEICYTHVQGAIKAAGPLRFDLTTRDDKPHIAAVAKKPAAQTAADVQHICKACAQTLAPQFAKGV